MAVTLYTDLVNGVDNLQAAKTGTAANPSGTITRVTYASAHGYSNGDYVWVHGGSETIQNQAQIRDFVWEVENVTTLTLDLKSCVWISGAASFSVNTQKLLTGLNTTSPLKSIYGGRNNSVTRVKKTADPISIGNATWTTKSLTITLASARTQTIDNCETAWTAANSATVGVTTSYAKQGTNAVQITTAAATATSTKYAYKDLGTTLDLSAYQNLSLKMFGSGWTPAANLFKICLCSDTTGDTIVDTFVVPAFNINSLASPTMISLAMAREGGGNLGSAIKSIAFYTHTTNPGNSRIIYLDNIIASKTDDIDHTTLLTKVSTATWHSTDMIVPIMSIDGTSVMIDWHTGNFSKTFALGTNTSNKGYYTTGTSPETVTTYIIKPLQLFTGTTSSAVQLLGDPTYKSFGYGDKDNPSVVSGGWNFTTNTQDGMTWLENVGSCYEIGSQTGGTRLENFGITRMSYFNITQSTDTTFKKENKFYNMTFVGISQNASGFDSPVRSGSGPNYYENLNYYNIYSGPAFFINQRDTVNNVKLVGGYGFEKMPRSVSNYKRWNVWDGWYVPVNSIYDITNLETRYNSQGLFGLQASSPEMMYVNIDGLNYADVSSNTIRKSGYINGTIKNVTTTSASALSLGPTGSGILRVINEDKVDTSSPNFPPTVGFNRTINGYMHERIAGDVNDNRVYCSGFRYFSQTTTRHTASGIAWQMAITSTNIYDFDSLRAYMPIARVACTGNKAVTVKAWVKKSNATSVGAALFVDKFQVGITTTYRSTDKANDTNWEELSVTFTPTTASVIEVGVIGWYVSSTTDSIYVDDVTVTEAA